MLHLVVFGSGRGSNFDAIYEAIENGKLEASIEAVFSNVEGAKIIQKSQEHGILTHLIPHLGKSRGQHEAEILEKLGQIEFDLILLAGYMRILSENFITRVGKPVLNIHPSLLPSFPGINAQKQALDYGVKVAGCTVHIVIPKVDAGPILGQRCVPVYENDTEESLSKRILEEEHKLFPDILIQISNGTLRIMK